MKVLYVLLCLAGLLTAISAYADDCEPKSSLHQFSQTRLDPDFRGAIASCLIKNYLSNAAVAQTMLNSIVSDSEHTFVKEDILETLAQVSFRKSVKVEHTLGSELSKEEAQAVDRTLASAKGILDVTKSVHSMNEVLPVTKFEGDFVVALSNTVNDDKADIMLRIASVQALSNMAHTMVDSGVYDEKVLYTIYDTLLKTSSKDDSASYYSGASSAFKKIQSLFQHYAVNINKYNKAGRQLSSVPAKN